MCSTFHTRFTNQTWFALCLIFLLTGCGYRFPGENPKTLPFIRSVQVVGDGAQRLPVLARHLQTKIERQLSVGQSDSAQQKSIRLKLLLDSPQQTLLVQTQKGRAAQYRIILTVKPTLFIEETPSDIQFPSIQGSATFYELASGTTNQAARQEAQSEALDQLVSALVVLVRDSYSE
ncbi:MAG: hypothetical protein H7832_05845 [Magnetococcus sp. DMHC-6]